MNTSAIRRPILAAVLAAFVVLAGVAVSAAPAVATPGSLAAAVARDVAAVIRLHPGARQLDATSVEVDKGVVITVPSAAERGEHASATAGIPLVCAPLWVCNWEHSWYRGNRISFYFCGEYNLFDYFMPNGRHWADQISSIGNNQPAATAVYFNWLSNGQGGGNFDLVYAQRPRTGNPNLADGPWNDKLDKIDPC